MSRNTSTAVPSTRTPLRGTSVAENNRPSLLAMLLACDRDRGPAPCPLRSVIRKKNVDGLCLYDEGFTDEDVDHLLWHFWTQENANRSPWSRGRYKSKQKEQPVVMTPVGAGRCGVPEQKKPLRERSSRQTSSPWGPIIAPKGSVGEHGNKADASSLHCEVRNSESGTSADRPSHCAVQKQTASPQGPPKRILSNPNSVSVQLSEAAPSESNPPALSFSPSTRASSISSEHRQETGAAFRLPPVYPLKSYHLPPLSYKPTSTNLFTSTGAPTTPLLRFSHAPSTPLLPSSRGVFITQIPHSASLATILSNVRGGAIERVDFHPASEQASTQPRHAGVYFLSPASALRYRRFCSLHGGVYWAGVGTRSRVDEIPPNKGGHEPVRSNVAMGIVRDGATRVLRIEGLGRETNMKSMVNRIRKQSRTLAIEFEGVYWGEQGEKDEVGAQASDAATSVRGDEDGEGEWEVVGSARKKGKLCEGTIAIVKMASIGTALGARCQLRRSPWYKSVRFAFLPDECAGPVEELKEKWAREKAYDKQNRRR